MNLAKFISGTAVALAAMLAASGAVARDASRPAGHAPSSQAPAYTIPNPYLPRATAPSNGDRAADAYATGFAIGLGSVLLNRQREEEAKRPASPQPTR